jgi:glutamate racemase
LSSLADQPIGIFDSGVGGLTVANAILQVLPNEHIIYFGDTAHLPYGDKSPDTIRQYVKEIGVFLLSQNCKVIIIACNSASSVAYDSLVEVVGKQAIVINVIDPVVTYILKKGYKQVGVIGTRATIGSDVYRKKIYKVDSDITVHSLATPLLAPMIESGFFNGQISRLVIEKYLQDENLKDIDTLVLACTHYPLIKKEIEAFYSGKQVEIVASNEVVAQYVKELLTAKGLTNSSATPGKHKFYVSDYTESFDKTTRIFYGSQVQLEQVSLPQ